MSSEEDEGLGLYWEISISLLAAATGYFLIYIKDKIELQRTATRDKMIDLLEVKLRDFLWPLYFRLHELTKTGKYFSMKELLDWNKAIFEIFEEHIYSEADQATLQKAIDYMKIFHEWRRSKESKEYFPFEEALDLRKHIQNKTSEEQEKYNILLGESTANLLQKYRSKLLKRNQSLDLTNVNEEIIYPTDEPVAPTSAAQAASDVPLSPHGQEEIAIDINEENEE